VASVGGCLLICKLFQSNPSLLSRTSGKKGVLQALVFDHGSYQQLITGNSFKPIFPSQE